MRWINADQCVSVCVCEFIDVLPMRGPRSLRENGVRALSASGRIDPGSIASMEYILLYYIVCSDWRRFFSVTQFTECSLTASLSHTHRHANELWFPLVGLCSPASHLYHLLYLNIPSLSSLGCLFLFYHTTMGLKESQEKMISLQLTGRKENTSEATKELLCLW